MTYEELIGYCTRAIGVTQHEEPLTLLNLVGLLQITSPANRGLNAEVIARLMAEYIEQDKRVPVKKPH